MEEARTWSEILPAYEDRGLNMLMVSIDPYETEQSIEAFNAQAGVEEHQRTAPGGLRFWRRDGGGSQPLRVRNAARLPLSLPRRSGGRVRQASGGYQSVAGATGGLRRLFGVRAALRGGRRRGGGRRTCPPPGDALGRAFYRRSAERAGPVDAGGAEHV